MPWARLDDTFCDHPKVNATSLKALGCHEIALSWCNRHATDGYIPASSLRAIRATKVLAEELVKTGLFDRAEGGYRIHDFLHYSKSNAQVTEERAASRERQSRFRNGVTTDAPSRTRPVPVPSSSSLRVDGELERASSVLQRIVRP